VHIFQILVVLFMFTGCGVTQEMANTNFAPNVFIKDDFALYDSQNESMVNIGMQRQEVEKVFGKHVDTIDFLGVYEYDGFKVHYKDNKVDAIMIDENTVNNQEFHTPRGTQYFSPFNEVVEKYGSSGIVDESKDNISLTYIVELVDGEYIIRNSLREINDRKNVFTISANFYQKEKLYSLMIADYFYSYSPTR
jgi:hypothetical protein